MKNYFFGINSRPHIHFDNRLKKDILSGNNYDHVRFVGKIGSGSQDVVSSTNWRISAIDPSLQGADKDMAIKNRMDRINEITGNNPNMKLSKESFDAIMSGGDVNLKIDLMAPERRNLFIGLVATIGQIAAGLAGGAYTKELGAAVSNRAQGDSDFAVKHGRSYGLNLFGGAEVQGGQITATRIDKNDIPSNEPNREIDKGVTDKMIATANRTGGGTEMQTVDPARKYEGPLSVENHKQSVSKDGKSVEAASLFNLSELYGKSAVDKTDNLTKVTSIFATQDALAGFGGENAGVGAARRRAVMDFLTLSNKAGLISDADLTKAKEAMDKIAAMGITGKISSDNPQFNALFKQAGVLRDVFQVAEKGLLGATGNKDDLMLGGQHITNLQKVLNDKIKENVDVAVNINEVVNGRGTINAATAQAIVKANPQMAAEFAGKTPVQMAEMLNAKLTAGTLNFDNLKATVEIANRNVQEIAGAINSKAKFIYK
jgi:hypothetical protein